jgi:hypothetical protein
MRNRRTGGDKKRLTDGRTDGERARARERARERGGKGLGREYSRRE